LKIKALQEQCEAFFIFEFAFTPYLMLSKILNSLLPNYKYGRMVNNTDLNFIQNLLKKCFEISQPFYFIFNG